MRDPLPTDMPPATGGNLQAAVPVIPMFLSRQSPFPAAEMPQAESTAAHILHVGACAQLARSAPLGSDAEMLVSGYRLQRSVMGVFSAGRGNVNHSGADYQRKSYIFHILARLARTSYR